MTEKKTKGLLKEVCRRSGLPYGNLMRWKGRMDRGEDPVHPAGSRKITPWDPETLRKKARGLKHGQKRTTGTGIFYHTYKDHVSRRQILALVHAVRRELNQEKAAQMRRICWNVPGIVWAIDDTEFTVKDWGWHAFINQIHVLGARYDLDPYASERLLPGPQVALRLRNLFEEHGAPLFIKLDNGKNLNHPDVHMVLAEYFVMALRSPTYYPPYNGAVERAQSELKAGMEERGLKGRKLSLEVVQLSAENVVYKLNHKERRVLDGQIACTSFSVGTGNSRVYSRDIRRHIFDRLVALATETLAKIGKTGHRVEQAAWRMAVESWLQENNIITITQNGKVLPYYPQFRTHN